MQPNQIAALVTGLWILGLSPAFAEKPDGPGPEGPRHERSEGRMKMKKVMSQLNLTPDQEKKLKEHRKAHREETKKIMESMKQKREAMDQEMNKPNFEESKVKALHSEISVLRTQMEDHRLQGILEVRKILTPEQFAKFRSLTKDEWKERGEKYGHKGPRDENEPKKP